MQKDNCMILFLLITIFFSAACSSRDETGRKLITALENDDIEKAISLLNNEMNVTLKNSEGKSALALAFEKRHPGIIKGIIEKGGILDEEDIKNNGGKKQ